MTRNHLEADVIDGYLAQWKVLQPTLRTDALAVSGRAARISVYYQRVVAPVLAQFELQHWEYDVLATLRRLDRSEGATMSELTDHLLLASGSTTHRVDQLVKRQLIVRRQDSENRRRVLVELTASGRSLIDRVLPRLVDALGEPFREYSQADWDVMDRGLRLVMRGLERNMHNLLAEETRGSQPPPAEDPER